MRSLGHSPVIIRQQAVWVLCALVVVKYALPALSIRVSLLREDGKRGALSTKQYWDRVCGEPQSEAKSQEQAFLVITSMEK